MIRFPLSRSNFDKTGRNALLLGVLSALFLFGGFFFVGSNIHKNRTPQQTTVTAANPTLNVSPTKGWKTFHHSTIQLKLPKDWTQTSNQLPLKFQNYKEDGALTTEKGKLKLEIYIGNQVESVRAFVNEEKASNLQSQNSVDSVWNETQLMIDGQQAIQVESGNPGFIIYTMHPTTKQGIALAFLQDFDSYAILADSIVSTIQFPKAKEEQKPTPTPTPTTITYTDKDFGYRISYPQQDWVFRRTFGKDIPNQNTQDIISGIDLHYNKNNQQASIVVNVLDSHRVSNPEEWITKYDPNYPKVANKTNASFQGNQAVVYKYDLGNNRAAEVIYFLKGDNAYRIYISQIGEILPETREIVNSFTP